MSVETSVEVTYEGHTVKLASGDTILEGLERAGLEVPSSCRAGARQFCMMRVVDGPVPPKSQDGLKDSLKSSGHFLACVSRPKENLTCAPAHVAAFRGDVKIEEIRSIGPDVVLVRFERPKRFEFIPGQFVTLKREDGLGRSYSIASSAEQLDYFDIHVRLVPDGRMSGWLHKVARPGDFLWAEGPKGDCTYYPGNPMEPLYLVGTGTGMAPLYAVAEDAVRKGHVGPIKIVHGGLSEDRMYLIEELRSLANLAPQIKYRRCVRDGSASEETVVGDLKTTVLTETTEWKPGRVYLCGDPSLVRDLKRRLFLNGISLRKIHADPFVGTEV